MIQRDIILGQIECPKCGMTYSTSCTDGCPYCNADEYFNLDNFINDSKVSFYVAPGRPDNPADTDYSIFLGGTIEGGTGIDWQKDLSRQLKTALPSDKRINVYNPRRPHWDQNATVVERINQIKWEHYYLDRSDIIVMNILGDSKSPISLMELGMYANQDSLLVFCPKSFYRYENVLYVCQKYDIPLYDTNGINVITEKVLERLKLLML